MGAKIVIGGIVRRVKKAVGFGSASESAPTAPAGLRLYAIGDVHGRADLLEALLDQIVKDGAQSAAARKIIIFLGDYVDRGLQSRQVLDRLTGPCPAGFEIICLKGNHETAMLQFLQDAGFGKSWKYYGGLETLHSYGITQLALSDRPEDFEAARVRFNAVLPPSHRDFLMRLELSVCFGDYFFAHAGVRPGISLARQVEDDLLWIRDEFLEHEGSFGKIIIHGHTPREEPVIRHNRIGIDTGAYMTNRLTCLVLEGTERYILQTGCEAGLVAAQ